MKACFATNVADASIRKTTRECELFVNDQHGGSNPKARSYTESARILRRIFDLFAASMMLVAAAPVMALTALAIWVEGGGPVIYRQTRVGLSGITIPDAEVPQHAARRRAEWHTLLGSDP